MTPYSACKARRALLLVGAFMAGGSGVAGGNPAAIQESSVESPETQAVSISAAHELLMQGAYQRAAAMCEALAAEPGGSLAAELELARCRERVGAYEEAIDRLVKLNATQSADWHHLLSHLLRLKGRYAEVIDHAREAIRLDANHAAARLILAETLELTGRRDKAIEAYRWFDRQLVEQTELPKNAAWITAAAVGFVRFSVLTEKNVTSRTHHALHEMLQNAYHRLDRSWWPARIAAADMLRAGYNNDETDGSVADYRAALRINPKLPEAHAGLGEVLLEGYQFEEVEALVATAQEINPRCPEVLYLQARKYLRERRYHQAVEVCEQALAINPHDLTALSLSAAAYACSNDVAAVEALRTRVAAVNPRCALLHRTLGDALGGIRQYPESEREYLTAIEAEPTDANARTELGMMYMQWGREDRAREVLEAAWALDQFNHRTKFTLDLLGSLESFAHHETPHFLIRFDAEQDPGLGPYLADCLEQIHAEVTADYNVALEERTIIEVFPSKRAFGVRITGKPWIHTVGACTGRVIALTSPRQSPQLPGSYHVAQVLKHEYTHTVTLAATDNRIPHWFTEGLAVVAENAPRPFPWTQLLAEAVRREELFSLESINWGFIRPRRPTDRTLAYAQSEWMCEFLMERFGYGVIDRMLQQFRKGRTEEEVMRVDVGVSVEAFDGAFREWAKSQVTQWGFDTKAPEQVDELRQQALGQEDSAELWGRLARAELDAGADDRALAAARHALALDGQERISLAVAGEILEEYSLHEASESGKRAYENEALALLEQLAAVEPDNWTSATGLARIALRRGERERAIEWLMRLQRVCPMDPLSWQGLAGLYLEQEAYDLALPQLLELARTNSTDKEIPRRIAAISESQGRMREAQYWLQQAIYIDPFDVGLHEHLSDVGRKLKDWPAVLRECNMLISLQPANGRHYESAALAANELGDAESAGRYAERAVQLDPASNVRSLIRQPASDQ